MNAVNHRGRPAQAPSETLIGPDRSSSPSYVDPDTAYERILALLAQHGSRYREGDGQAVAQCPSHDDREASLGIYRKPGKVQLVCFAGCDAELDVLPALGLEWPDKYDEPDGWRNRPGYRPDPAVRARAERRRKMTLTQRALDDLLRLPDLGQRLCRAIAWQETVTASGTCWWWRAVLFDQARPRTSDHPGGPVDWESGRPQNPPNGDMLAGADRRCYAAREACLERSEALNAD
jgi:hypothetical protein